VGRTRRTAAAGLHPTAAAAADPEDKKDPSMDSENGSVFTVHFFSIPLRYAF
jgi:hypothetical protein